MNTPPLLLHRDDLSHGVDQYARAVAEAVARLDTTAVQTLPSSVPLGRPVHVHFTDRLWGSSPEGAASRFERLASRGPVSVTLHDVPQASDGEASFRRRSACFRRVVEAASGTVVNSRHEQLLLERALGASVDVHVVPLPAAPHEPLPAGWAGTDEVAVLGFFYPGKGHREVVDAVATLDERTRPGLAALGRASPGHERELEELARHSEAIGVRFSSTGFLTVEQRVLRCREVGVPVIAHQHVSASGSLTDWLSAGRKPVTVESPYFREMDRMRPGTMSLVSLAELPAAIEAARVDPSSTWLAPEVTTSPDIVETAQAYLAWWSRL